MHEASLGAMGAITDFAGRDAEMAALVAGLAQARDGRGSLFLIGGEPGIGKSRLADEVAARARQSGARMLWGKAWDGAGAPAYWPWIQALRSHLRSVDPAAVQSQLGSGAADVAQILPEIAALLPGLPGPPTDSDSARFQLFDSTTAFLRNLGAERETLLVLDDLHAADAPSIMLLRFIASQLAGMRMVVIGTYRDMVVGSDHPLGPALAELAREPTTRLLLLKGLSEDAVGRLIEATAGVTASARLAREMWRETGGNPLFLGEAVRLLQSERRLDEVAAGARLRLTVPPSIRDVIARRVGQLSSATVEGLTIGAALGPEFSLEVVRRIAGYAPEQVLTVLDEAVDAGLLLPVTDAVGRYRFSHDLVRESVYQAQPSGDRIRLHRRIATTLEEMYGSVVEGHLAELAHHYMEAAHSGHESATEAAKAELYSRRAAEHALSALAYEEAARLFRMALTMLDVQGSPDDEARSELLLRIGDAEARAGELETSNHAFRQAADLARRTGRAEHLARAALGVGGRLPWARPGNNVYLLPLLEEALMSLGGGDDRLRVRLLARVASAWRSTPGKRQQSEALSRQAVELARRLDDAAALSYALAARYWATWWPENPHERLDLTSEMISISEQLGDPERMVDARLMLWLSHTELGRMDEARRQLDEVRRVAEELRQPAQLWLGVAPRALMALMEGDYPLAARLIEEESAPGPPTTPARDNVSIARFHRFLICREQARPAEAEQEMRRAVEEFPWYPFHRAALSLLLLDMGRRDEAASRFEDLARNDFAAFYRDNEWLLGVSLAAEAAWRLGDSGAATVLYGLLEPFAGRHAIGHAEGSVGAVDRYLGMLALTLGRLDDAESHLLAAIDLNDRMGARPWAAHSRTDLALLLRSRAAGQDLRRAAELEQAARATALDLGMTALLERLDSEGPVPAAPAAPDHRAALLREGDYWTVHYDGESFRVRDSKGLHYLARLLGEPGRELLALDLATPATSRGNEVTADDGLRTGPAGGSGSGPALDEEAKRAYRERLAELQAELSEAEEWHDPERAERARTELDFLVRELSGAVGLGGRDRPTGSASERARLSVTRAIRSAIARLAEHSRPLGEHLEATVHTGTYCVYRPDTRAPLRWQVEGWWR